MDNRVITEREFWEIDSQKVNDVSEDMYDELDWLKDEDYEEDWE